MLPLARVELRPRDRFDPGAWYFEVPAIAELRDIGLREPREPQPDDAFGPVDVDERRGELRGDVGLVVAEGRHDQHPRRGTRPDEMAHEPERRRVRPVDVLEDDEERPLRADADEQVGDRRVQPVALGVRIGRRRRGRVADTGREPREEARQLAATLGEVRAQRVRIGVAHEVLECRRERPVGRADGGVAVAVEHRCALGGDLAGELAHEPALAGAGLAGEKRRAAPFPGGTGQERPERRELPRASCERERRSQAKRAGKGNGGVRDHR